MNQLDKELLRIKTKVEEMWDLVDFQLTAGREALLTSNPDLAKKVIKSGKKVNAYDIKIDRMCENIFALFNPVAVDLRWVLAILKINSNLERIGDYAESIAHMLKEANPPIEPTLLADSRFLEMFEASETMLKNVRIAFLEENTELARQVIKQDKLLNKIHGKTDKVLMRYFQTHPDNIFQSLKVSGIIRKLERIGDHTTNIAEEIVFYVDAKVVKHQQKKKKNKGSED
ncbi:phosphate signaling complex protein PhoU [Rufibacter latericius]|uniref:Phosphate-specific transport system accessory protein PhoU n=1 Tax=Rufibacter latericius TaxID=2487040 RepID=A0A3M9N144_9BACT|nr:phosphate signaling complex protein PhoU [Rufibacter latericius]RNI31446.1 phosphate signaling complex protein PhoU [Rufibacter latericius]